LKETMAVMLLCGAFATTDLQKSEAEGKFNCFRRSSPWFGPRRRFDFNNRVPPLDRSTLKLAPCRISTGFYGASIFHSSIG
jgi:hypothetical protein